MSKDVTCIDCAYFDQNVKECTIDVDTDDFEKCMKMLPDGSYEFCPLYGGYPKETDDA